MSHEIFLPLTLFPYIFCNPILKKEFPVFEFETSLIGWTIAPRSPYNPDASISFRPILVLEISFATSYLEA